MCSRGFELIPRPKRNNSSGWRRAELGNECLKKTDTSITMWLTFIVSYFYFLIFLLCLSSNCENEKKHAGKALHIEVCGDRMRIASIVTHFFSYSVMKFMTWCAVGVFYYWLVGYLSYYHVSFLHYIYKSSPGTLHSEITRIKLNTSQAWYLMTRLSERLIVFWPPVWLSWWWNHPGWNLRSYQSALKRTAFLAFFNMVYFNENTFHLVFVQTHARLFHLFIGQAIH